MATTELVKAGQELAEPDSPESVARIEALKDELPALIEAGDIETIKRWRDEGKAASLAAQRLGFRREANGLARHAIYCAASLGVISGETAKRGDGAHEEYRTLGAAMDRGRLEQVLNACGPLPTEHRAVRVAQGLGVAGVSRKRLQALVRKKAAERGETINGLTQAKTQGSVSHIVYGRAEVVAWWTAKSFARDLGLDIDKLPLCRRSRKRATPRAKWLTHKPRPGGGKWDEVGVRWIKMRDEMTRADPNWPNKPSLYEAMKTVTDIIQREIRAAEK